MVMVLPVAGILLGGLMGFDTLHTLFATVPGLLCLTAAALLLLCGARWNRRLLRRAETQDAAPGIALELIAIGMAGGGSVDRAVALARSSGERFGLPGESTGRIDRVIALSTRAGVPAAELLRSEADQARRDARSDGQRKAATLAVTLMLPLGLCVLPAFMLVGVVPLLLAVLSSTFAVL
jgi:tight adherence protein B